jgi:hypothetical protein
MDDLEKYILEQANIEVEYTRSWPNKLLAFYVAINFGLAGSFLAFASRDKGPATVPVCAKTLITIGIAILFFWTMWLLIKNHLSYLDYRNVQIKFQKKHLEKAHKDEFLLPKNWFELNVRNIFVRGQGWGYYGFITVLVTAITMAVVWGSSYLFTP